MHSQFHKMIRTFLSRALSHNIQDVGPYLAATGPTHKRVDPSSLAFDPCHSCHVL